MEKKLKIEKISNLEEKEKKEIEGFLEKDKNSYFMQSLKICVGRNEDTYVLIYKEREILGATVFVLENIKMLGKVIKNYGGVVLKDEEDLDTLSLIYKNMLEFSKKKKAFLNIVSFNLEKNKEISEKMKDLGFIKIKYQNKMKERIENPYYFNLDLKNKSIKEIKKNLSSKTRYLIRIGKEKNIKVFKEKIENIDKKDLEKFNINLRKYENFKDNINIFIAKKNDEIISLVLTLYYGNKTYLLNIYEELSIEDFEYGKYMCVWEFIKDSKKENKEYINLMSFPGLRTKTENIPPYDMYRFKKSFGGELVERMPEFIFSENEIKYNIYNVVKRFKK